MSGAERQKRYRERSAANKGVLSPEVDLHELTSFLVDERLLDERAIEDRGAVTKALERVLRLLPKLVNLLRVTSNKQWDW
jgi:hypothetical protein